MMALLHRCFVLAVFLTSSYGDEATDELDEQFSELVSKGLISKERLEQLKQELLDDGSDEIDAGPDPVKKAEVPKASSYTPPREPPRKDNSQTEPGHPRPTRTETKREEKKVSEDPSANAKVPDAGARPQKRPRAQSMEESMRAFGVDPDAIAKLGQKREPTDINGFVNAAMQAAQAHETARTRDAEALDDAEELQKEKLLGDDAADMDVTDDSDSAPGKRADSLPDLGRILPGSVKGKLAGILGRLGDSLDPEASALLSQLMPDSDEGDADGDDDGSTEDLAGLMASLNGGGGMANSFDLEKLEKEHKEADERREKEAAERKVELARREAKREKDHEIFEAEMRENEEKRKKDREEFEEGRRKHAEYMEKMEERKKKAAERRAEMEERRAANEDRMADALRMAAEHINELKGNKKSAHDDL